MATENAYALLTNIQGFDSFSLGPSSSAEEIARAFQTQTLIWHPEKNPGDAQAEKVYSRMLAAYNTLMDPEARRVHDAALQAKKAQQAAATPTDGGTPGPTPFPKGKPNSAGGKPHSNGNSSSTRSSAGGADAAGKASEFLELEKLQRPPEDLGAPPPSARPFAYVDKEPGSSTPAGKAGLHRGDALLRIGDAAHLRDVQGQLQASLHQPLPALVIDIHGRFLKKWIVPHAWDSWAPASLLGCQMSDQCPHDLVATHPVEVAQRHKDRRSEEEEEEDDDDDDEEAAKAIEQANAAKVGGRTAANNLALGAAAAKAARKAKRKCYARALLLLSSIGGLCLGGTIIIAPAVSYEIFDVWKLANLQCDSVIDYIMVAAVPPAMPPPPQPPGGYSPPADMRQRRLGGADDENGQEEVPPLPLQQQQQPQQQPQPSQSQQQQQAQQPTTPQQRQAEATATTGAASADVVENSAMPPQLALAPPPRAPKPSPPPAPRLITGAAAPSPPPPPPPSPTPEEVVQRPAATQPKNNRDNGDSTFGFNQNSVPSSSSSSHHEQMGSFIKQITATNVGVDVIRNPVLYLLYASGVIILISLLGIALACCPPSRTRGLLTAVYLSLGIPSWIFLVFVSVSALALRDGATQLVEKYWQCLKKASPTGIDSGIPDAYRHVDAAASICIAAAFLLLLSLICACSSIGWRRLTRHSITCISMVSGLVGAATLAVGVVLKATSNIDHQFFDGAVMGVGGCVFLVSLIGVVGSKQESKCLLRTYAAALAILILVIMIVASYLLIAGDAAVHSWLEANWNQISQHICTSAMNLCAGTLITRDEIRQRASAHLLEITTLLVLLLLVLLVDLMMAFILQYIVAKRGRKNKETEIQMKRLVAADDQDEEEEE